jgi:hypothetical protein
VVGHDDDRVVVAQLRQRFAHQRIHFLVGFFDHAGVAIALLGSSARMLGVAVAPEHVGELIRVAEVEEQAAALEIVERVAILAQALVQHQAHLLQELVLVQGAMPQRLGVLRNARRVVPAGPLGQLLRE